MPSLARWCCEDPWLHEPEDSYMPHPHAQALLAFRLTAISPLTTESRDPSISVTAVFKSETHADVK